MRICFITREVPPNVMGGIGTYVENIGGLLAAAGHDVTFLTEWNKDAPTKGIDQCFTTDTGIRIYYLPFVLEDWVMDPDALDPEGLAAARLDLAALFAKSVADALESLIPKLHFDVIEAPEYEAHLSVFLGRRLGLAGDHVLRKVPCLVHLHSPSHLIFEHNDDDGKAHFIYHRKRLEMETVRLADGLLSPSAFLADQVAEDASIARAKIAVIPYPLGVPLPTWKSPAPRPDGFHFLFVGRIEPRKGVFEWFEAAVEVAEEYPNVYFHFVGGTHIRTARNGDSKSTPEFIQSVLPQGLRDRIIFHEKVPRLELGRFYHDADCCVVPSRWDNYPNTCMEAMGCAKPVLASEHGGMVEMIEHDVSGFIAKAPYGDRVALKNALVLEMKRILSMPPDTLQQVGQAARKRIEAICANETVLDQHLELYQRLVREKSEAEISFGRSKPSESKMGVALILSNQDDLEPLLETVESVTDPGPGQSLAKVIVAGSGVASELPDVFVDWERIENSSRIPGAGLGAPAKLISRLIEASPDVLGWVFLLPGMKVSEDFFRRTRNCLEQDSDTGFCLVWQRDTSTDEVVGWSPPDANHLILQSPRLPLCGVFRTEALREVVDLSHHSFYFGDVLKDYAIHMIRKGWQGRVLPSCLCAGSEGEEPVFLSHFRYFEREDSSWSLIGRHRDLLETNLILLRILDGEPATNTVSQEPVTELESEDTALSEAVTVSESANTSKRKGFRLFGRKIL